MQLCSYFPWKPNAEHYDAPNKQKNLFSILRATPDYDIINQNANVCSFLLLWYVPVEKFMLI